MKREFDPMSLVIVFIVLNFISFTLLKFNRFKEKYHTFYECNVENKTSVYNGKEFKMFKSKYEALNKMSPDCKKIKD